MKRLVPLIALSFSLLSCEKRSVMEGIGIIRSPSGNWSVELISGSPGISIVAREPRQTPFGKWGKTDSGATTPGGWENHPGAFVYFDDQDRVWAFNGTDRSFIYQNLGPDGRIAYDFDSYNHPFPDEVLKRLPEELLARYKSRGT